MANIKTITGAVAEGSQDIQTVLTEGATAIKELSATAVDARKLVQTVQTTLDSLTAETTSTLGEARSAIGAIRGLTENLSGEFTGVGPDAREMLASLKKAADALGESQRELTILVGENREPILNFTSAGLYEFTQLVSEARVLVDGLARVTGQFERDPARFLFGDSQQGVGVR
jgi:phospholipid/cholesterol/gamma-HCH transport system substrate-binding protein